MCCGDPAVQLSTLNKAVKALDGQPCVVVYTRPNQATKNSPAAQRAALAATTFNDTCRSCPGRCG